MPANESTPTEGQESVDSESIDWEAVGRRLLQARLERKGEQIRDEFFQLAHRVGEGEPITPEDARDLSSALADAHVVVEEMGGPCRPTEVVPEGVDPFGDR